MTSAVLSPYTYGSAVELAGGLWRKKLLPVGEVQYKGRILRFTADYLRGLAQAFCSGAYDQVPFQLADAQNTHTNDPERTRGEIVDMDVADDGLWITAKVTPAGDAVLSANPRLGVSARIVEDYARSDGQHYAAAVQHVLGTLDPRIPALGDWQAIEASNGAEGAVIDLSGTDWIGEPTAAEQAMIDEVLAEIDAENTLRAYGLAEEGEANGEDGESPMDGQAPDDDHWHEHGHTHADGTSHSHGHPHDHAEAEHDEPGETQSYANDGDHEHAHAHTHMGAGHHVHLHAHGHESGAHQAQHNALGTEGFGSGGDAGQLANRPGLALELANLDATIDTAFATERARLSQDARRPARMTAEARLSDALARIGTSSYLPSRAARALGFAGEANSAGQVLAQARWHPGTLAAGSDGGNCGPSDEYGYCREQFHSMDCGSLADPEVAGVLAETGVYADLTTSPWRDENGRTWANQAGTVMDLVQHLEHATGQRMMPDGTGPGWQDGAGSRETITARRVTGFGEPDDPDDPGTDTPAATRRAARQAAAAMGITAPDAVRERERYRQVAHDAQARVTLRTMGRRHADFGESPQERAARMKTGVQPVQLEDTQPGAQPQYVAGQL
jgi:hypothetical protein